MKEKKQVTNSKKQVTSKRDFSEVFALIFIGIFLIPSIIGLLHSGFPSTDDGGWMIIRFSAFYEALRHGQFPVRFLMRLNNGYGYPVADFLYPLFMYIGVPLHIIGINFTNTIKVILGGSLLFSGIFTYLWLRKLFDRISSFVAAVAYTLFPYHLYDVYQRGSVGEVLALCVVPFIFWQIERRSFVWISLGIALLILSHNTLALLFLPFIIMYMFIKQIFSTVYLVLCISLSLALSTFFWLPALYDKQFTVFDTTQVSNFTQYFLQTKNFGLFGIFALMVSFIGINFAFKRGQKHDIFFLGVIYVWLFCSLPVSSFLWNILPLPQFVQFPFRFLSIVILGVAFMTAFMLSNMKSSLKMIVAVLSMFLIYAVSWPYLFPKTYTGYPDSYYSTNQDSTTVQNEYMPKWVKTIPANSSPERVQVVKGAGSVSAVSSNGANKIVFSTTITKPSILAINTIYFPGWQVLVNNTVQKISNNNSSGIMEFALPSGTYTVVAKFSETPIRLLADCISLLGILLVVVYLSPLKELIDGYFAKLLRQSNIKA